MISVLAVYEKGVLRPTEPLDLNEGETVELTVARPKPQTPPLTVDEWGEQLLAAKSIEEWVALANACPDPGPDIDLVKTINESRRLTGFRLPDPIPNGGEAE
jgi:predicted DNA-binding antitoxin AbrB/MazE fold protein